jgi:hypothetical protein
MFLEEVVDRPFPEEVVDGMFREEVVDGMFLWMWIGLWTGGVRVEPGPPLRPAARLTTPPSPAEIPCRVRHTCGPSLEPAD